VTLAADADHLIEVIHFSSHGFVLPIGARPAIPAGQSCLSAATCAQAQLAASASCGR